MGESLTGTTDENGDCEITDVPVGDYTLTAELEGYADYTGDLTVDGDETVNIELNVLDTLTITVENGESTPIEGATVTIGETNKTTNSNGQAEFTLIYGDYTATISATGYITKTEEMAFRSNHKTFTASLTTE